MATQSEDEARRMTETLLKEIEFLRQEASERGERFEALTEEQLFSKIRGQTSMSPFFTAQTWGYASPGGSTFFTAYVGNPDPSDYSGYSMFGHLFFGPANFIGNSDVALTSVDRRLPQYYQRCGVAAGSNSGMSFTIDVPAAIRPGIYMGNCFLVLRGWLDVGSYFARTSFDLTVS